MVFGFNTIGKTIKRLEAEQAEIDAALPGMTEYQRRTTQLGCSAVGREFLLQVHQAAQRDGRPVGWTEPPFANALWPVGDWTESQRAGFDKCHVAASQDRASRSVRSSFAPEDHRSL